MQSCPRLRHCYLRKSLVRENQLGFVVVVNFLFFCFSRQVSLCSLKDTKPTQCVRAFMRECVCVLYIHSYGFKLILEHCFIDCSEDCQMEIENLYTLTFMKQSKIFFFYS